MEFRCGACGFRSFHAQMFVEEQRNELFTRRRCIGCGPAHSGHGGRAAIVLTVALLLLVSVWIGQPHTLLGYLCVSAASLAPAAFLTSVTHELGHAAATWMTGGRVLSIMVGSGPVAWRLRTPLFELEMADNPLWGGQVQRLHGDAAPGRWKEAVVLAGGSAANILADMALFALLGWLDAGRRPGEPWSGAMVAILALAAAQTLSAVMNLWPWSFQRDGDVLATDGGRLLMLFRDAGVEELLARARSRAMGPALLREGRKVEACEEAARAWMLHGGASLFSSLVDCADKAAGPEAAVRIYLDQARRMPGVEEFDAEWSSAMGKLAWRALLARRPDWVDLADRLSARAAEMNPHGPVKATRGAILMAMGELEAGEAMILAALPEIEAAADKAEFCDFLARHRLAGGEEYLGAEYARLSRHLAAAA